MKGGVETRVFDLTQGIEDGWKAFDIGPNPSESSNKPSRKPILFFGMGQSVYSKFQSSEKEVKNF